MPLDFFRRLGKKKPPKRDLNAALPLPLPHGLAPSKSRFSPRHVRHEETHLLQNDSPGDQTQANPGRPVNGQLPPAHAYDATHGIDHSASRTHERYGRPKAPLRSPHRRPAVPRFESATDMYDDETDDKTAHVAHTAKMAAINKWRRDAYGVPDPFSEVSRPAQGASYRSVRTPDLHDGGRVEPPHSEHPENFRRETGGWDDAAGFGNIPWKGTRPSESPYQPTRSRGMSGSTPFLPQPGPPSSAQNAHMLYPMYMQYVWCPWCGTVPSTHVCVHRVRGEEPFY